MPKVFNVAKYRQITADVLRNKVTAKGTSVNWEAISDAHRVSNNLRAVFTRIGVISRTGRNQYKLNTQKYYVSNDTINTIVDVIHKNHIVSKNAGNDGFEKARQELLAKNIIRVPKASTKSPQAPVAKQPHRTIIISKNPNPLSVYPTTALLDEIRNRITA